MKILNFGLQLLILNFAFLTFIINPAFAGELANQFTIELWVKPVSSASTKALLVKNNEIRLVTNASSQPLCQIYSGGAWQTAVTSSTAIPLNNWSHVACTYDKTTLKVFLNGVQVGSQSLSVSVNDANTNFRVGSDESGSYSDLNGSVDDVRIYNYARTEKQIVEDMNAGHPAVGSPVGSPILYLKFDEGYGSIAYDSSINRKNGTIYSGTLTAHGKIGSAIVTSGSSSSYIYIDSINIPKNGTISMWFKPNQIGSAPTLWDSNGWIWLHLENSTVNWYGGRMSPLTGGQILSGNWYHVVVTWGNGGRSIYLNGVQIASDSQTPSYTPSQFIYIGKTFANYGFYNGYVDEVKLYNYALSEDEIKQEYNRGSAIVLGSLSDTSALSGGSVASNSASAEYCVPGSSDYCAPPVAEWKFEEGSGTTVYDTSGNNNNGTWYGTGLNRWVPGKIGKAGNFNGSDDYVYKSSLTQSAPFTVEFWLYPSNWTHGGPVAGFSSGNNGIMSVNPAYTIQFDNCSKTLLKNPLNKWNHFAFVKESNGITTFYQNAFSLGSSCTGVGNINYIYLGRRESGFSGWKHKIDQFRIYNYARTPAQIAWDYNRGEPIAHWKFDECQGTTAYDSSGNNNNGTITIGASGSQTSAGTCTSSGAWYNGVNGKFNASLNFDGTDDYVATGNIALITADSQNYSNVSWSTWVKATNNQTGKTIIHKSGEFRLYTDSNGYPTCQVGDTGNTAVYSSTLPNNTWSHLICTYDGSNIKLYLNGSQVASNSRTGSITSSNSTNVNIGQRSNASERYAGQIDDVRIYNYALTPVQIKNLYNESSAIRFGQ